MGLFDDAKKGLKKGAKKTTKAGKRAGKSVSKVGKQAGKTASKAGKQLGGEAAKRAEQAARAADKAAGKALEGAAEVALEVSQEAERIAETAAKELKKFGGDVLRALQQGLLEGILVELAQQLVKDFRREVEAAAGTVRDLTQSPRKLEKLRGDLESLKKNKVAGPARQALAQTIAKESGLRALANRI